MTRTEIDENGDEITYDDNGNMIHIKESDGFEQWFEYDSNGRETHYKDTDGFEVWPEYDSKGNVIHLRNSDGFEVWYDSKGNVITKEQFDKLNAA